MNIYFSCSITGGRQDQEVYAALVDAMQQDGHIVPTAHLSSPDVMQVEAVVDPQDVYLRDVAWVEGCDVVIAEVSTPSHGVGYEIALACLLGKPVF
jgi:2'-deoxynucleoside 5'-phosphate N-hydrolase